MLPVYLRDSLAGKVAASKYEVDTTPNSRLDSAMSGSSAVDSPLDRSLNGTAARDQLGASWPRFSRHNTPGSSKATSPVPSLSPLPLQFPNFSRRGGPAGLPSPTTNRQPGNNQRSRHFMRPNTSLPFGDRGPNPPDDMMSEVKRSFAKFSDKDFGESRGRGERMKTALRMEGDHHMTSLMSERYIELPGGRLPLIRQRDTFHGFAGYPGFFQKRTISDPGLVFGSDIEDEDPNEFAIPSYDDLEGHSRLRRVVSGGSRDTPIQVKGRDGDGSVISGVMMYDNVSGALKFNQPLPERVKKHKNEGTWLLN